jgi:DNA modification methylase
MIVKLKQIHIGKRYRKDYGDLSGIKESLKNIGSIHPVVISKRSGDSTYDLVAGGRRMRCFKELGVEELHHASVLNPEKYGFVFDTDVPKDKMMEAELDENLYHLKTKWTEDCLIIADLHALKRKLTGYKWGVVQTAQLLGKGYGKTNVNYAVRIAERLRAGDKEFIDCENMSDAIALLVKRKEEAALAELQRRTASRMVSIDSLLDTIHIPLGGPKKDKPVTVSETVQPEIQTDKVVVPLSAMFYNGDFREVHKKFKDGFFDHVITDIPYAIDMDNLDVYKNIEDVIKEHQVEENVELFEPFLQTSFRLVKSGGFCVFFYDLDWHEYLQATAAKIGWKVQRWPLIAHKTSACRNSTAQYNFTKNYECVMVLRRDEKTVLRSQQPSSVWSGDFAAERRLYNNPFAKPFELWKWLYDATTIPGQRVWSPFCGEMSESRAAVNCGLVPFGCELKQNHYLRGLENMKAIYALVHKSNVEFT